MNRLLYPLLWCLLALPALSHAQDHTVQGPFPEEDNHFAWPWDHKGHFWLYTSEEDNRERNRELWAEWTRFGEATGVPTGMIVTHAGWNDLEYAPRHYREKWHEIGQPEALIIIQPRYEVANQNWQRDLQWLIPEGIRSQVPEEITERIRQEIMIPIFSGQNLSLTYQGQTYRTHDPGRPDTVQARAAVLWGYRAINQYLAEGTLLNRVGKGPEQYTAIFEAHPQAVGSFDDGTEAPAGDYPTATIKDTVSDYTPAYQLVNSTAPERVAFSLSPPPAYPIPGLYAATTDGQRLTMPDSTSILLSGLAPGSHEVGLYAPTADSETDVLLGLLRVQAYTPIEKTVHLIPVGRERTLAWDPAEAKEIEDSLNAIYDNTAVRWTVVTEPRWENEEWDINSDGFHPDGKSLLSAYPPEAKALLRGWKRDFLVQGNTLQKDHYYLFLVDGGYLFRGYMPRKSRYGFVFLNMMHNDVPFRARVIAHELGHGAFRFQHWYDEREVNNHPPSQNLMDYAREGTDVRYRQWEQIRNPPFVVTALEVEEDGAYQEYYQDTWTRNLNEIACALYQGADEVAIQSDRPPITMTYYQYEVKFLRDEMSYGPQVLELSTQEQYEQNDRTHLRWKMKGTADSYLHISVPTADFGEFSTLVMQARKRTFRSLIDVAIARPQDDIMDYVAQLPTCSCELLSLTQRTRFLGILADEGYITSKEEAQVNRLMSTTPKRDQTPLLNYLEGDPEMLQGLYEGVNHQQARDEFLGWITTFWTGEDLNALKGEGQVSFDLTRGGLWNKVQDRIDYQRDGQKLIFNEAYTVMEAQDRGRHVVDVEVTRTHEVFRVSPLEPVYVLLPEGTQPITLPALAVKNFTDTENWEESVSKVKAAIDVTLLLVGAGEIAIGFRALRAAAATPQFTRALVSITLGAADVTATSFSTLCTTDAQSSGFCQTWNDIGPYIEVGLLSASMVDLFYNTLRRQAGNLIEEGNLPAADRTRLEEVFPQGARSYDQILSQLDSRVVNKIDALETTQRARFLDDCMDNATLVNYCNARPDRVTGWQRLKESPLRFNEKYLDLITDIPSTWGVSGRETFSGVFTPDGNLMAELKEDIVLAAGGAKGRWNQLLNRPPIPSHRYQVDNYLYETDQYGRVKKVSGNLELRERGRYDYQQGRVVELKDGVSGQDEGGHLIANILFGPGEQINYLPQTATLNKGAWRNMEREWAKALEEGKNVRVEISPIFEGSSKRPEGFEVDY
ncbi:MAG: DNA/RNA non-specific endonuclease, partial [Bacteroidota bacterium]